MKRKLIAGILALALVATAFAVVSPQTNSGGSAPIAAAHPFFKKLIDDLTK